MSTERCHSCNADVGAGEASYREHYRSALHTLNLRRRVADLPPVSLEAFEKHLAGEAEKQAQAEAENAACLYVCDACGKTFGSEGQLETHIGSKKHVARVKELLLARRTAAAGGGGAGASAAADAADSIAAAGGAGGGGAAAPASEAPRRAGVPDEDGSITVSALNCASYALAGEAGCCYESSQIGCRMGCEDFSAASRGRLVCVSPAPTPVL